MPVNNEYHREQRLSLSRQIRIRIREYDNELYSLLKAISGVGLLTSSALITELGDINRFPHIKLKGRITIIGMNFVSFLILLVISIVVSAVLHYVLKFYISQVLLHLFQK